MKHYLPTLLAALLVASVGAGAEVTNAPSIPTFSAKLQLPTVNTNCGIVFAIGKVVHPSGGITVFPKHNEVGWGAGMLVPFCQLQTWHTRWDFGIEYVTTKIIWSREGAGRGCTYSGVGFGFATELNPDGQGLWLLRQIETGAAAVVRVDNVTEYGFLVFGGMRF